jgi:hypothetical protein
MSQSNNNRSRLLAILAAKSPTISPFQGPISPVVSPVSSIDEKSPEDEPPSTLPLNSPKVETSLIVEILMQEVIEIRAQQDSKHDHLVQIINNLTRDQDTLVADIAVSTMTARACISKIDAFEKKIEDFLREPPEDDGANKLPHLWPIPDVPMHTPAERTAAQPSPNVNPIYHDEFDSLAPKVLPDTNFFISRSIPPVNPALSQVKLTDLSAKSVFIWGE